MYSSKKSISWAVVITLAFVLATTGSILVFRAFFCSKLVLNVTLVFPNRGRQAAKPAIGAEPGCSFDLFTETAREALRI